MQEIQESDTTSLNDIEKLFNSCPLEAKKLFQETLEKLKPETQKTEERVKEYKLKYLQNALKKKNNIEKLFYSCPLGVNQTTYYNKNQLSHEKNTPDSCKKEYKTPAKVVKQAKKKKPKKFYKKP